MKGQYYLDGQDLWDTYGVMLERGSTDDLLALPNPKPFLAHDWEDEDGEDVLTTPMKLKARDVTLNCLMVANGEEDFWEKYNEFYEKLLVGAFVFCVSEFDDVYRLQLRELGKLTRYTRIKETGKIIVRFTLKLRQVNPAEIIYSALVDDFLKYPIDADGYFFSE